MTTTITNMCDLNQNQLQLPTSEVCTPDILLYIYIMHLFIVLHVSFYSSHVSISIWMRDEVYVTSSLNVVYYLTRVCSIIFTCLFM